MEGQAVAGADAGDARALAWLNGPGPRLVMELDDRWQFSAH
jgi:hypothetical protein